MDGQDLVARNAASRQRLRDLVAPSSGHDRSPLARSVIATSLAHLAFWDRFVYARWNQAAEHGLEAPPEIADAHTQLVNDVGFPQWRTIPFEDAARDALAVAETLDGLIERIDPQVAERLIAAGRGRLVDRSIHRNEHLDDLQTDSDHRLGGWAERRPVHDGSVGRPATTRCPSFGWQRPRQQGTAPALGRSGPRLCSSAAPASD